LETQAQRKAAQAKAEQALKSLAVSGVAIVGRPNPTLIRAAETTVKVLRRMRAEGLAMPHTITIAHGVADYRKGPSGAVHTTSDPSGLVEQKQLVIEIPKTIPDDVSLDDAVHAVFSRESRVKPYGFNDPDYKTYDGFAPRTMEDVVVHEMAHVNTTHRGPMNFTPGRSAKFRARKRAPCRTASGARPIA
jgi:hypothetical protein